MKQCILATAHSDVNFLLNRELNKSKLVITPLGGSSGFVLALVPWTLQQYIEKIPFVGTINAEGVKAQYLFQLPPVPASARNKFVMFSRLCKHHFKASTTKTSVFTTKTQ